MAIYEDSYCTLWNGPRRGGKSSSMAYEDMVNLLAGKRVFADSPVSFDFQIDENYHHHYETEPLNYYEFLQVDEPWFGKKYDNSVISWDEIDKKLFARNFQSVFSKIISQFITYIGKHEISFLMTAQFESLVDKNIRIQLDNQCRCIDLSFKYPHLGRGTTIGQTWRDISGRTTGEMFEYDQQEYQQTFYAKTVWEIYNTKHAAPLLESMEKIKIEQPVKVFAFGQEDLETKGMPDFTGEMDPRRPYTQEDTNSAVIFNLGDELRMITDGGIKSEFTKQEIIQMAKERGYRGSNYVLLRSLESENLIPAGRGKLAMV